MFEQSTNQLLEDSVRDQFDLLTQVDVLILRPAIVANLLNVLVPSCDEDADRINNIKDAYSDTLKDDSPVLNIMLNSTNTRPQQLKNRMVLALARGGAQVKKREILFFWGCDFWSFVFFFSFFEFFPFFFLCIVMMFPLFAKQLNPRCVP